MNYLVINWISFRYKLAVKTSQHRYLCNNSCGYRKNLTLSILISEKNTQKNKTKNKQTKQQQQKITATTTTTKNNNKKTTKKKKKKKNNQKTVVCSILLQKWNSMQIDIPVLVYQAYSYLMHTNIPTKPYSKNVHCLLFCICGIWINCVQKWRAMTWESLFMPYANNKGTNQPAHPHRLISAFGVRCLDSIIPLLAIAEISRP